MIADLSSQPRSRLPVSIQSIPRRGKANAPKRRAPWAARRYSGTKWSYVVIVAAAAVATGAVLAAERYGRFRGGW